MTSLRIRLLPLLAITASFISVASATTAPPRPSHPASAARPGHSKSATRPMVLPFIHDDYARAVAEARARRVPIFIEAWAPW